MKKNPFFELVNKKFTADELKEIKKYNDRELDHAFTNHEDLTTEQLTESLKEEPSKSKTQLNSFKGIINQLESEDVLQEIINCATQRLNLVYQNKASSSLSPTPSIKAQ